LLVKQTQIKTFTRAKVRLSKVKAREKSIYMYEELIEYAFNAA